jgi:hypothetical protein
MFNLKHLKIVNRDWLEECTLNQKQVATRLEITERYLRDLDQYYPPRTRSGCGFESRYLWPAVMFWWTELQMARADGNEWAFQNWCDRVYYMRLFRTAEERLNDLIGALRTAGASKALVVAAGRVLVGP